MKQWILFAVCAGLLWLGTGCQKVNKGVEVVIKDGGQFPEHLVGKWKADRGKWEFVFEPDGTISSAVIDSGVIRVRPDKKIATRTMRDGGKATYKLGQWTVQYSPAVRELAVKVVVEHYRIDMGTYGMQGNTTDWFTGTVSEDWQTWEANWFTFPKSVVFGDESMEFPFDPNDNPIYTVVFTKQSTAN